MVQIKSAYYPERKYKNFKDWFNYIKKSVEESNGIQNEIENI